MPLKPDRLERSLKLAQDALDAYEGQLNANGVDASQRKKNPRWRNLSSTRDQIQGRIQAANDLATRSEVSEEQAAE